MIDLISQCGFTMYPNVLMDRYMKELSPISFKMMSVICRKTIGFNKEQDSISQSQFMKYAGISKASVQKGINELIEKGLIIKSRRHSINTFQLNPEIFMKSESVKSDIGQKLNPGIVAIPQIGQNTSIQVGHDLNTQKTISIKKEIQSSTTIFSKDVYRIAKEWNTRFDIKITKTDKPLLIQIEERLKQFSIQELFKAMENRLKADYYKFKKLELLHLPTCFFSYPKTIQNDLKRGVKRLYTYDEKNAFVASKGYLDSRFELRQDKFDSLGRGMWELKS